MVQTQLDETDLTGAILTGAFIEDWGITSSTILNGVRCEYVYMRLPTKEDPEPCRKPDNRSEIFEDGDFADFIKPIVQTLDLYHNQGVDPRAIAISWTKLAEDHPDAQLRFSSMEVKGEDNLLLRLKTTPVADKSELSAEYFETYNQLKALAEAEVKELIGEKDNRIASLEIMVNTALNRPSFYAENYNHKGDNEMTGEQRKIEIKKGNYNEKIEGNYYEQSGNFGIGHMSGGTIEKDARVAGVINEAQSKNLTEVATKIEKLLDYFEQNDPPISQGKKIVKTAIEEQPEILDAEIVEEAIKSSPTLKQRIGAAGEAAYIETVKMLLPPFSIAYEAYKAYKNPEKETP